MTSTNTRTTEVRSGRLPVDRQWIRKLLRKHGRPDEEPALVLAPMVDQSDLPFRMICRDYGVNLCFTPMIHAKLFMTQRDYRRKFTLEHTPAADRPLIAQICGSDIEYVVATAKELEPYCDGIDLNCGCPQGIAKRGRYGAFLLEQPDTLLPVVEALLDAVQIPVSVKVRLLPAECCKENIVENNNNSSNHNHSTNDMNESPEQAYNQDEEQETGQSGDVPLPLHYQPSVEASLRLYHKLVDMGVHLLTIHGRTRYQKGPFTNQADWKAIRRVVDELGDRIPIFANGSIGSADEARKCLEQTGCDGIMSSEGLLEYPPLLQDLRVRTPSSHDHHPHKNPTSLPCVSRVTLARQYLEYARQYPPDVGGQGNGIKCMRVHIHRFCHADLQDGSDVGCRLRDQVVHSHTGEELLQVVQAIQALHEAKGHDVQSETLSWYQRHRQASSADDDNDDDEIMNGAAQRRKRDPLPKISTDDDDDETTPYCSAGFFGGNDDEEEDW